MGCQKLIIQSENERVLKVVHRRYLEDGKECGHYYPFGLQWDTPKSDKNGNSLEGSGSKSKYSYNGKELVDDMDINIHDYGFRYYDPAIARFTTIDPLAEEYHFQSGFAYAANNPIKFIDFLGLGPIYDENDTLIRYEVEEGQGPTQIAEDLNEFYSCELSCEADWTQIVYDNGREFQNVFDGDGNVTDAFNEDFKSGNIKPGTKLEITNGKEGGEFGETVAQNNSVIADKTKDKDSINAVNKQIDRVINLYPKTGGGSGYGDNGTGRGIAAKDLVNQGRRMRRYYKNTKKVEKLDKSIDSLKEVNKKLKDQ